MEKGAGVSAGRSEDGNADDTLPDCEELMSWLDASLEPVPCNASLWQQDEYKEDDMLLKLGSDFTVRLVLCSVIDAVADADDNNEDAGSFRDSDDKFEGLISELDELEE